ncbi:MAG: TonB-dependent siderophore receptor [Cellvibrio sp.]|uniref:TonB-dependent siderophore receptor n=1 Tax=Cellvibrio sp. TaxID=1965322 RepID=UPI0031B4BC07
MSSHLSALNQKNQAPQFLKQQMTALSFAVSCSLLTISGSSLLTTNAAQAAEPVATATSNVKQEYKIAAGKLSDVLAEFSAHAGVQLVFEPHTLDGQQSSGLQGQYSIDEGFSLLLADTDLAAERDAQGQYRLRKVNKQIGKLTAVKVSAEQLAPEDSMSYTATQVSLAKGQTVRDVPQSVSVVTRQRIEDQNLNSLGDVMLQTTGVTMVTGNSGGAGSFYARGFQISNVQIDGASVDSFSEHYFNPNLGMYEQVEIVRGADGLFSGAGEPGGAINLVRKRPKHETQLKTTLSAGKWNNYFAEGDITGSLAFDGKLRGRAIISYTDREYFYETAEDQKQFFYGTVEADLTNSTLLALGLSYERDDQLPARFGLPRYRNGEDIGLPRNTATIADWQYWDLRTEELFARVEQKLGDDWLLKVSGTYVDRSTDLLFGATTGAVDPNTLAGTVFSSWKYDYSSEKTTYDINLSGSFELFGHKHKLLAGADGQDIEHTEAYDTTVFANGRPVVNIFTFDGSTIPKPTSTWRTREWPDYGAKQRGYYSRLQLQLADPLKLVVGGRYSSYEYASPSISYNINGAVTSRAISAYEEDGIFTPYGGLVYDLNGQWSVYGSVTEIYKSQANRLEGPLPGSPLDAITGSNQEVGVKGEFRDGRLTTSFAVYRTERNGEAVRDPNYPSTAIGQEGLNCCWIDRGEVLSEGVDLELSGELLPNWNLFAGYTYNRNSNEVTHVRYHSVTPKHLFKLWSTHRLPAQLSAWRLGGGVTAQSNHFVSGTVNSYNQTSGLFDGPTMPFEFTQGGYAVWNAFAEYIIDEHWLMTVNFNNLFDKTYYKTVGTSASGNWYGEPSNWSVTLRGQF